MEFFTSALLGGIVYDLVKMSFFTLNGLTEKLKKWNTDPATIKAIFNELSQIDDIEDKSEKALEKLISRNHELNKIIENIQKDSSTSTIITQNHTGTGDNIGGDKITTINN